jgi:hypothetical protein
MEVLALGRAMVSVHEVVRLFCGYFQAPRSGCSLFCRLVLFSGSSGFFVFND